MLPTDSETGYLVLSSGAQSIIYSISALINPTLHNVLVDNYIPGSNCVLTDSFDGMGKIVDYAVEAGCQRFIFAKSFVESLGNLYNEERAYAGVYHCRRHGYECAVIDSSYEELLQAIASKKQVKTCVMFSQDEGAYRLKKLLKGHKRNVLVAGFDDYKGFEKSTMPLTTIRVNKFEMIKAAIEILTRPHVWRKKIIRIPGDLIIRE
jgi:DNA-binding LacI/PurR family transcriptional regulator